MTTLELLYFDGCPNHPPLGARLRDLLAHQPSPPTLELVRVETEEDARGLRFLGSPSVRVNGTDVEPAAAARTDYGLKCRLYHDASGVSGTPPDALILTALADATLAARLARAGLDPANVTTRLAARLDPQHQSLHRRVLSTLAAGELPTAAQLRAWACELELNDQAALNTLETADLIRLGDRGEIVVAYPFSALPTKHHVSIDNGADVWAMCAIDAFGIPHMLGRSATIDAVEPDNSERIEVRIDPGTDAVHAAPATAAVLVAARGNGCSAECRCPHINLFATAERAQRHLTEHDELEGEVFGLQEAVAAGRILFGTLLGR